MSICVDKNVLRLQISVRDAFLVVQVVEDENNLGSIELRC